MQPKRTALSILLVAVLACQGADHHRTATEGTESGDRLTPGKVEMSIARGMPQSDVIAAIGNPNIITTDAEGRQVWTWDKMSRTTVKSSEAGGLWIVIAGVGQSASSETVSERTMTLIIYFDHEKKVRDVAYHMTSF